jgi:hypothetical protein
MEMPVWVARNLYAPVQIIVDRFWVGIGRRPGRGRSVMPPVPISYFMIRCGIANRDRVIVSPRPEVELAALRAGPGDDGRDVLTSHLGRPGRSCSALSPFRIAHDRRFRRVRRCTVCEARTVHRTSGQRTIHYGSW